MKELGGGVLWASDNFERPPRRSWPYPPTELERIAERLGIDDEELRQILRDEVERRRASVEDLPDSVNSAASSEEPRIPRPD